MPKKSYDHEDVDIDRLRELYTEQGKTKKECAKIMNVPAHTIKHYIAKYRIRTKSYLRRERKYKKQAEYLIGDVDLEEKYSHIFEQLDD